jgi:IclR family acetate operon transcriptional repressor
MTKSETQTRASSGTSATIATVERAADVLLHFAAVSSPDLGVTEIAEGLGMPKAAVHRVLASLRGRDLVELDPRTHRYSLGVAAMRLGHAYLDRIDVRAMARPQLVELCARTRETATLSVPLGARSRIYVDQVLPQREVLMTVTQGEPYALHAGASSRAMLAFQSVERIDAYLNQPDLARMTPDTIVDIAALRADLAQIREQGWALSVAERKEGAASVAAPVRNHDGHAIAVISVCGPAERFQANVEACRSALLEATAELSRRAGWGA